MTIREVMNNSLLFYMLAGDVYFVQEHGTQDTWQQALHADMVASYFSSTLCFIVIMLCNRPLKCTATGQSLPCQSWEARKAMFSKWRLPKLSRYHLVGYCHISMSDSLVSPHLIWNEKFCQAVPSTHRTCDIFVLLQCQKYHDSYLQWSESSFHLYKILNENNL